MTATDWKNIEILIGTNKLVFYSDYSAPNLFKICITCREHGTLYTRAGSMTLSTQVQGA